MILGGETGFCVVRGNTCKRAHNTPFHVNDITRLPDSRVAAIGRYRRMGNVTVGYCMTAALGPAGLTDFKACRQLPGGGIEDAIRSMAVVSDDTLAIVGSDDSLRLLTASAAPNLTFAASPDRAVLDRAIWLTDMVVGPGWILVRGQDNQIYEITGFLAR